MQLDAEGNVYLNVDFTTQSTGSVGLHLDTDLTLPMSPSNVNLNKESIYLIKYSSEGNLLWYKTPQPPDITIADSILSESIDLQTDAEGNSWWFVQLRSGIHCDGQYVVEEDNTPHILRYDANGNFIDAFPLDMQVVILLT